LNNFFDFIYCNHLYDNNYELSFRLNNSQFKDKNLKEIQNITGICFLNIKDDKEVIPELYNFLDELKENFIKLDKSIKDKK